jgi:hypothetical protein
MRLALGYVVIVVLLASGCAGPQHSPAPRPRVNLAGFSAAFKQGYADGCDHALSLAARKDEQRYRRDADYASGWNDGYSMCRRRGW